MTPGMTTRLRRASTGSRLRRITGSSPTSPRPRPMWLPARNRATGTTSPCRSMTAATTGGILPRAADVLCGSSPELPHFSFPAASGYRARPGQLRTPPARALRAPPATGGEDFGRTKIFPAMTHLYKIFFCCITFWIRKGSPLPANRKPAIFVPPTGTAATRSAPIQSLGASRFFVPALPARHLPAPCATPQSGL